MSIDLDEFKRLKEEVERKKQKRDKAKGAFEQFMKRIKEEFGGSTLKQGKRILKEEKKKKEELERRYHKELEGFKSKLDREEL